MNRRNDDQRSTPRSRSTPASRRSPTAGSWSTRATQPGRCTPSSARAAPLSSGARVLGRARRPRAGAVPADRREPGRRSGRASRARCTTPRRSRRTSSSSPASASRSSRARSAGCGRGTSCTARPARTTCSSAAGDGPCAILMLGARPNRGIDYPRSRACAQVRGRRRDADRARRRRLRAARPLARRGGRRPTLGRAAVGGGVKRPTRGRPAASQEARRARSAACPSPARRHGHRILAGEALAREQLGGQADALLQPVERQVAQRGGADGAAHLLDSAPAAISSSRLGVSMP